MKSEQTSAPSPDQQSLHVYHLNSQDDFASVRPTLLSAIRNSRRFEFDDHEFAETSAPAHLALDDAY